MEQKITQFLQETYHPTAIILHGSRASGHERTNSDWDFILLYETNTKIPNNGRIEIVGENIEYSHHQLPIADVLKEFSLKLQNTRVVYEKNTAGSDLIKQAQGIYSKPLGWTEKDKASHALWMRGRIDAMRDTVAEPVIYEKYAADFYGRITNYWYWAIHDKYPKPIYLALEEISEKDTEYYNLITQFVLATTPTKKVEIAQQIYERCFG